MSENKKIIVKVQQSLSPGPQQMLIYDPTREFMYEGPLSPEVKEMLNGRAKAYYMAELVPNKKPKGTFRIAIIEEAEEQSW